MASLVNGFEANQAVCIHRRVLEHVTTKDDPVRETSASWMAACTTSGRRRGFVRSRIALFPWLALVCLKEKWKWRVTSRHGRRGSP